MRNERVEIISVIQYKAVILRDALLLLTQIDWDTEKNSGLLAITEMAAAYAEEIVNEFEGMEKRA